MSDTPRTDARQLKEGPYGNPSHFVCADFARELERENAMLKAATRNIEQLQDDNQRMLDLLRAIENDAQKDGSPFAHNVGEAIRSFLFYIWHRDMMNEANEIQANNYFNAAILE